MKTMRFFTWLLGALLMGVGACRLPAQVNERDETVEITSLRELHRIVTANGRAIVSFRMQGVVCASPSMPGTLVLQDASGAVLLELPGSQWHASLSASIAPVYPPSVDKNFARWAWSRLGTYKESFGTQETAVNLIEDGVAEFTVTARWEENPSPKPRPPPHR